MAEVSHASKQWAEVHKLSLFMMATVLVELRAGGAQAVLDAPQSIVFDLGPPRDYDGSPSTALTLASVDISHQASLGSVTAEQWSPPVVALRTMLARSFRTANGHPDIVGVLPTTFYVQGAQLAAQTNLPLHRRRPRIPGRAGGALALDERTKKALYSLLGVCMTRHQYGRCLSHPGGRKPGRARPWTARAAGKELEVDAVRRVVAHGERRRGVLWLIAL